MIEPHAKFREIRWWISLCIFFIWLIQYFILVLVVQRLKQFQEFLIYLKVSVIEVVYFLSFGIYNLHVFINLFFFLFLIFIFTPLFLLFSLVILIECLISELPILLLAFHHLLALMLQTHHLFINQLLLSLLDIESFDRILVNLVSQLLSPSYVVGELVYFIVDVVLPDQGCCQLVHLIQEGSLQVLVCFK